MDGRTRLAKGVDAHGWLEVNSLRLARESTLARLGFGSFWLCCSLLVLNRYAHPCTVLPDHHRHHVGKGSVIAVGSCAQCFFDVGLDTKGQGGCLLCGHDFQRCFFAVDILQCTAKLKFFRWCSVHTDFTSGRERFSPSFLDRRLFTVDAKSATGGGAARSMSTFDALIVALKDWFGARRLSAEFAVSVL